VRRALERLLARQVVAALAGVRAGGLRGAVEPELGALLGTLRLSAAVPALSVRAPGSCERVHERRGRGRPGPQACPGERRRRTSRREARCGRPCMAARPGRPAPPLPLPAALHARQACWRAGV
jgi:hypothetical protein